MSYLNKLKNSAYKNRKTLILLVVVAIVLWFLFSSNSGSGSNPGIPMISAAGKPKMFYSMTCPYSRKQMKILEDNNMKDQFQLINCQEQPEECKGVSGVPAFDFGGKKVSGLQSAEKLGQLLK